MVKRYGHRALAICLVFLRYVIPYVRLARGLCLRGLFAQQRIALNLVITGLHQEVL